MTVDWHVGYESHLKNGHVWRVEMDQRLHDSPYDVPDILTMTVDVVAPNRDLAQYIAVTMYPDYESISISDEPLSRSDSPV